MLNIQLHDGLWYVLLRNELQLFQTVKELLHGIKIQRKERLKVVTFSLYIELEKVFTRI